MEIKAPCCHGCSDRFYETFVMRYNLKASEQKPRQYDVARDKQVEVTLATYKRHTMIGHTEKTVIIVSLNLRCQNS